MGDPPHERGRGVETVTGFPSPVESEENARKERNIKEIKRPAQIGSKGVRRLDTLIQNASNRTFQRSKRRAPIWRVTLANMPAHTPPLPCAPSGLAREWG